MTARMIASSAFVILVSIGLASCGSARRDTSSARLDDPHLVHGKQVFDEHCHACHPGGQTGLAPAINDKPVPAWLIKTQIRAGLGAMPAFPIERLSNDEVDDVAAYVISLRKTNALQ
jgi:mono/diheme cytochrome c family protein